MVDHVAIIIPSELRIDFFFTSYEATKTGMSEWVDELIEDCDLDELSKYCDPANPNGDSVRDLMGFAEPSFKGWKMGRRSLLSQMTCLER